MSDITGNKRSLEGQQDDSRKKNKPENEPKSQEAKLPPFMKELKSVESVRDTVNAILKQTLGPSGKEVTKICATIGEALDLLKLNIQRGSDFISKDCNDCDGCQCIADLAYCEECSGYNCNHIVGECPECDYRSIVSTNPCKHYCFKCGTLEFDPDDGDCCNSKCVLFVEDSDDEDEDEDEDQDKNDKNANESK